MDVCAVDRDLSSNQLTEVPTTIGFHRKLKNLCVGLRAIAQLPVVVIDTNASVQPPSLSLSLSLCMLCSQGTLW